MKSFFSSHLSKVNMLVVLGIFGISILNLAVWVFPLTASPTAVASNSTKESGSFRFRLKSCKTLQTQVKCDFEVVNLTSEDRTLYVASKQTGGIANVGLRPMGVTTLINADGTTYQAEEVSFANMRGADTGQSFFRVYSATTPLLHLVFKNVESATPIVRLDLVVGEATPKGVQPLSVSFNVSK